MRLLAVDSRFVLSGRASYACLPAGRQEPSNERTVVTSTIC
jgi:hypothetical protein